MSDYVLLTEKTHRARKQYICCHCAEPIVKGEKYVYTSGANYTGAVRGTIQFDRWHAECRAAITDENWARWTPGEYRRGTLKKRWDK